MKLYYCSIGLMLFLLLSTNVRAQDYSRQRQGIVEQQRTTRAQIEKLEEQIQTYENRLAQAEEKYQALNEQYSNLKNLIALQDQKLSKMEEEQSQILEEIELTESLLQEQRHKLVRLIENYKKTLSYLYKHGRTSQLALIFTSGSINQMLMRAFYLDKFNTYREQQAAEIRETENELEGNKEQLEEARNRNQEVLNDIRSEKQELTEKRKQQERNVALLRQNVQDFRHEIEIREEQINELDNTLTELAREDERLRRLDEERSEPSGNYMASEELEEIGRRFAENRGSLPWPVSGRTISEHFGNQRHPVYGTVTPNLGIVIVTDPQEEVRVVHDGYVFAVQPFPGYGDVVMVKHGRFITAYGNLSSVKVRNGQQLRKGEVVGLSGDEDSAKGEGLFFLVREGNENVDPERWLGDETITSIFR